MRFEGEGFEVVGFRSFQKAGFGDMGFGMVWAFRGLGFRVEGI